MIINNEIRKQIVKSPDSIELRQMALRNGMISIGAHGSDLVKKGITTVTEVLRVSRGLEDLD